VKKEKSSVDWLTVLLGKKECASGLRCEMDTSKHDTSHHKKSGRKSMGKKKKPKRTKSTVLGTKFKNQHFHQILGPNQHFLKT
jgi:hypothetical protein